MNEVRKATLLRTVAIVGVVLLAVSALGAIAAVVLTAWVLP